MTSGSLLIKSALLMALVAMARPYLFANVKYISRLHLFKGPEEFRN
jgi:hypothetical protein